MSNDLKVIIKLLEEINGRLENKNKSVIGTRTNRLTRVTRPTRATINGGIR